MNVLINPKTMTSVSTGSCTISGNAGTELVRFYEGDKYITESYLNTAITVLSVIGISARSNQKEISIIVEEL